MFFLLAGNFWQPQSGFGGRASFPFRYFVWSALQQSSGHDRLAGWGKKPILSLIHSPRRLLGLVTWLPRVKVLVLREASHLPAFLQNHWQNAVRCTVL